MTPAQRQQRQSIRNYFLTAPLEALRSELEYRKARKDQVGVDSLQEMIDECEKHGVDNFGDCPF